MKTVAGFFDGYAAAKYAADELTIYGVHVNRISLVAGDLRGGGPPESGTAPGAVGDGRTGGTGVPVGLTGLTIPQQGPVIAAGPVVAALAGAGMGAVTGGLAGALASVGVEGDAARVYVEGIRRGGALVAVECGDDEAGALSDLLARNDVVDIAQRAEAWRRDGWRDSDPAEPPYTLADIEREQALNRSRNAARG